jgi:CRISPR-associated protein Csm1
VIRDGGDGLPLPYDRTLSFEDRSSALVTLDDPATIRVYAKNKFHVGELQGTRLWVGDYFAQRKFSAYASAAGGISRLGVLRLDVDNLGQAFTRGFMAQGSGTYNTISRTAAFSRMLSMFFRQHINYLLEKPKFRPITGGVDRPRRASIIYSGGDDLFVVGAWDDVVELAIEVRDRFTDYVQGKLTVSAGIGMFPNKYPVSVMARETGDLESAAKALPTKDALALFDTDLVFDWDTLRDEIIEVKYRRIADFFAGNQERGAAFIYRLLGLLSDWDDPMSLVHWVYLLSRLRDVSDDGPAFKVFSDQLHRWFSTERDKKQLRVALYLYMYANRDEKKGK